MSQPPFLPTASPPHSPSSSSLHTALIVLLSLTILLSGVALFFGVAAYTRTAGAKTTEAGRGLTKDGDTLQLSELGTALDFVESKLDIRPIPEGSILTNPGPGARVPRPVGPFPPYSLLHSSEDGILEGFPLGQPEQYLQSTAAGLAWSTGTSIPPFDFTPPFGLQGYINVNPTFTALRATRGPRGPTVNGRSLVSMEFTFRASVATGGSGTTAFILIPISQSGFMPGARFVLNAGIQLQPCWHSSGSFGTAAAMVSFFPRVTFPFLVGGLTEFVQLEWETVAPPQLLSLPLSVVLGVVAWVVW